MLDKDVEFVKAFQHTLTQVNETGSCVKLFVLEHFLPCTFFQDYCCTCQGLDNRDVAIPIHILQSVL